MIRAPCAASPSRASTAALSRVPCGRCPRVLPPLRSLPRPVRPLPARSATTLLPASLSAVSRAFFHRTPLRASSAAPRADVHAPAAPPPRRVSRLASRALTDPPARVDDPRPMRRVALASHHRAPRAARPGRPRAARSSTASLPRASIGRCPRVLLPPRSYEPCTAAPCASRHHHALCVLVGGSPRVLLQLRAPPCPDRPRSACSYTASGLAPQSAVLCAIADVASPDDDTTATLTTAATSLGRHWRRAGFHRPKPCCRRLMYATRPTKHHSCARG